MWMDVVACSDVSVTIPVALKHHSVGTAFEREIDVNDFKMAVALEQSLNLLLPVFWHICGIERTERRK